MCKRLIRIFCLIVTLSMIFTFISCAETEDEPVETTTAATTTTAAATTTAATTTAATTTTAPVEVNPLEKHFEISWLRINTRDYQDGQWDQIELEEKFNVKLNVWNVYFFPGNAEQVDMMLAAGDVPDWGMYYKGGRWMIEQDMCRTLTREMIEKHLPSYTAIMNEDPVGWHFNKVNEQDAFYRPGVEEYYGLTMLSPLANFTRTTMTWRLDWLENIGFNFDDLVKMPVDFSTRAEWAGHSYPAGLGQAFMTNRVFSFDEVNEIFRAFTEDDPNGNGEDDTFGAIYSAFFFSRPLYGMFGIDFNMNSMFLDPITDNVVPYIAHPGYRDYLAWVADMKEYGYLRDLPVIEDVWWRDYATTWNSGKVGMISTTLERFVSEQHDIDDIQAHINHISRVDPEARFVLTQVPDAPGYQGANIPNAIFAYLGTYNIGAEVSDEKLERLLLLLEYAYFGENWHRYKFGIEGIHYTWQGEPWKSSMITTPPEKLPRQYATSAAAGGKIFMFGNDNFTVDLGEYFNFTANPMFYKRFAEENGWFETDILRPHKYYHVATMPLTQYEQFREIRDETIGDINVVHNDFIKRFDEGQIADIRVEWSEYIDRLYAAGIDQWVEIFNDPQVPTFVEISSLR